jgi:hypothetical protein
MSTQTAAIGNPTAVESPRILDDFLPGVPTLNLPGIWEDEDELAPEPAPTTTPTAALTPPKEALIFPPDAIVGSLGEFARFMADGTEVPEEFYFVTALTFMGASCGDRLTLNAELKVEPRLYTTLLGESGDVKKSTALRNTEAFFQGVWGRLGATFFNPTISHGAGSAEGLALSFDKKGGGTESVSVILCLDELKALFDKAKIESSTLLPMVTSLFEQNSYENATKKKALKIEDARLSLIGCCTLNTYESMWTAEAVAIKAAETDKRDEFIVNLDGVTHNHAKRTPGLPLFQLKW